MIPNLSKLDYDILAPSLQAMIDQKLVIIDFIGSSIKFTTDMEGTVNMPYDNTSSCVIVVKRADLTYRIPDYPGYGNIYVDNLNNKAVKDLPGDLTVNRTARNSLLVDVIIELEAHKDLNGDIEVVLETVSDIIGDIIVN